MEYHARKAHAACPSIVESLNIPEQLTSCRPDRMQHRVCRGEAADPIAVAHARNSLKPSARVARRGPLEQAVVKEPDLLLKPRVDRMRIAKFRPDVAQVDATDIGDSLSVSKLGGSQRLDESVYFWVLDGIDSALHQVVKRADQNWHDRKVAFGSQKVLKKHDLKLDRVFGTM